MIIFEKFICRKDEIINQIVEKDDISQKQIILKSKNQLKIVRGKKNMVQRYLFKTIIAGSGGTGKTTLLYRFKNNKFLEDTKITIGVEFSIAQVGQATLQLWDFAGEERFRDMLPSFCLGANGCIMVFDLGNAKSFLDLSEWLTIIRNNTKTIPVILVGTKLDLIEEGKVEQAVSDEKVKEFLDENNILKFIKISSKNGQNVTVAFDTITNLMLKNAGVII